MLLNGRILQPVHLRTIRMITSDPVSDSGSIASAKIKKPSSQRRIEANRRNSTKSTGPKTPGGKAVSRMNALKHGLRAEQVVLDIDGKNFGEFLREYEELRLQFWNHYEPVGPLEAELVDRIVSLSWRIRRIPTAEAGEIMCHEMQGQKARDRQNHMEQLALQAHCLHPNQDVARFFEETSAGIIYLMTVLARAKQSIERDGELSTAALEETHFNGEPTGLTRALMNADAQALKDAGKLDEAALKLKRKERLLKWIDSECHSYESKYEKAMDRERCANIAQNYAALLPPPEAADKILRYETVFGNLFHRAIEDLDRLQERRKRQTEDFSESEPIESVPSTSKRAFLPNKAIRRVSRDA